MKETLLRPSTGKAESSQIINQELLSLSYPQVNCSQDLAIIGNK